MNDSLELELNERNKKIGILIAVLAGILAFTQSVGQSASSDSLRGTIEASNTWSFFQAKTIRMATLQLQATDLEISAIGLDPGPKLTAINETIAKWRAMADKYNSEPATGEGRKELAARAKALELARDDVAAKNATCDLASSALQLAILLASAAVVTSVIWLAYLSVGIGILGSILFALALWLPHLVGG